MNNPSYIGIDIGTTNVKVLLVDEEGQALIEKSREYPVQYPKQGWAEQDPDMWVKETRSMLDEVCSEIPKKYTLKSIGISGQMHGLVVLDKDKNVLRPAILWNDQRSKPQCDSILNAIGGLDQLLDLTNNGLLSGYSFPKLIWLKENEPKVFKQIAHILLPKDYVRFRLSGHLGTDYSDASGTGCFDVKNRKWATQLIERMEIPLEWFPQPYPSTKIVGEISGLPKLDQPVPVVTGSGDAVLQPLASGVTGLNDALLVVGTGGNVTVRVDGYGRNEGGKVQFFCDTIGGQYVAMGVTLSAGESLRWIRNLLNKGIESLNSEYIEINFDQLIKLAETSPEGSNDILFTPYLQGERCPHANPDLRASFTGLSSLSSLADMVRSILEGVAFSLKDVSLVLESIGIHIKRYQIMGGGGKSDLWNIIFSNILNKTVSVYPSSSGGTAYGSAILARIGFDGTSWVKEKSKDENGNSYSPDTRSAQLYAKKFNLYQSIYQKTKP